MSDAPARTRPMITATTVPSLPKHVKLRHDAGRNRWIILAPERVFNPDETAVEVLKQCDGVRTVQDIAAQLAKDYSAPEPEILADVIAMLQDLSDKGVLKS